MEIQQSKSNNREWAEMRDERERGRGDESKREDEEAAVNSRTLGNESAALVMKWNDRESLRGWREGDGEDGRSWSHDGDERCVSRVGVGCLSAANIVYVFSFGELHSRGASLQTSLLHWFWPRVVQLDVLSEHQQVFKSVRFLFYCFPDFCCKLCQR